MPPRSVSQRCSRWRPRPRRRRPPTSCASWCRKGRAAEAYAAGKRGDAPTNPEFAYYFGVAAIDSGHAGEGVLALERYLARFPADERARFDLARGYYALGDLLRAREAFETVLGDRPSAERRATVERFLDSIQAQASRHASASSLYFEFGGGVDSNAAAGLGATALEAPLLDGLLPAPADARRGAGVLVAGAGARFARPLAGAFSLEGGMRYEGRYRLGSFDRQLDQDALGGYGELSLLRGRDLYRARLSYSALAADDGRYRNLSALGGEWRRQMDELNSLSLFAQYAGLAYPPAAARDSNLYALGAGWQRAFVQRYLPVLQVQALYGRENSASSPVRDDLVARPLLAARPRQRHAVAALGPLGRAELHREPLRRPGPRARRHPRRRLLRARRGAVVPLVETADPARRLSACRQPLEPGGVRIRPQPADASRALRPALTARRRRVAAFTMGVLRSRKP